jgi:hypothetical protein
MDFREVECGMDWIIVALDRDRWRAVVNSGMGLCVPYNAGNFFDYLRLFTFWERTVLYKVSSLVMLMEALLFICHSRVSETVRVGSDLTGEN